MRIPVGKRVWGIAAFLLAASTAFPALAMFQYSSWREAQAAAERSGKPLFIYWMCEGG